jgi:hypothetical protein
VKTLEAQNGLTRFCLSNSARWFFQNCFPYINWLRLTPTGLTKQLHPLSPTAPSTQQTLKKTKNMFFFTNLELLSFIVEYAVVFFHLNTNYRNVFSWLFNRTVFEMTASFCQTKRNPKLFSKCVLFSSSMCFRCQNYSPFSQLGNSFFFV